MPCRRASALSSSTMGGSTWLRGPDASSCSAYTGSAGYTVLVHERLEAFDDVPASGLGDRSIRQFLPLVRTTLPRARRPITTSSAAAASASG